MVSAKYICDVIVGSIEEAIVIESFYQIGHISKNVFCLDNIETYLGRQTPSKP